MSNPRGTERCPKEPPRAPTTPGTGLDAKKRAIVLTVLANGNSRRVAARYADCAASTIARTAAREPAFQAQIARAEQSAQVDLLRRIRVASQDPPVLAGGRWTLEHINADDFGPRPHNTLSVQQVSDLFIQVFDYILDEPTDDQIERRAEEARRIGQRPLRPALMSVAAGRGAAAIGGPTAPGMAAASEPPLEDGREDPIATGNEPPLVDGFESQNATHPADVV